jgi:hypothetical protein
LTENVAKGTELTLNYGNKSNIELLQMYGFVVARNPFDVITAPISDKSVESWKLDLVKTVLNATSIEVSVSWEGVAPCGLLSFLSHKRKYSSAEVARGFKNNSFCSGVSIAKETCQRLLDEEVRRKQRPLLLLPALRERVALLRHCVSNFS